MLSWVDLERDCPIEISRIVNYARSFDSKINFSFDDLDKAKESLLDARGDFDLMVTSLIQLLYDREILKKQQDHILFNWLKEDLGRFLGKLDEKEDYLLIEADHREEAQSRVSISRISSYAKTLKLASNSIIYETLLKSTKEYHAFKETDELKREKRTFLYILFQVLQVTLSVISSFTRDKSNTIRKREMFNSLNPSWGSMMNKSGQKTIEESYTDDAGENATKNLKLLFDDEEENDEYT